MFSVNMLILFIFIHALIFVHICSRFNFCTYLFMHCIELPHASHTLILWKHTQASKLGGVLAICPMIIGQGSDV